jgi:rhomboid-like protein
LLISQFTAGSFISVTIWEYEKIRSKALNVLRNSSPLGWIKKKTQKQQEIASELQTELNRINKEIDALWNKMTPGERVFVPILALNCLVFAAWRVPRLKPFMLRYFASNPAAKAVCWPMFLSTFSHYSMFHLFANMYVLHSFSAAANSLGREQFVGLYLSAGVFASLTSYLFKFASKAPGYSLGASGAIMAVLAYVCNQFPDTQLSILFIPQFHFNAGNAIQAIMAFDLAGIIFRWRLFDHAAHLGGACFGLFWSIYGQRHLWPLREHVVGLWHELRGKPQK